MKIAFIGSRGIPATYSGFETFYEQVAIRLVRRGHEVTVYNRTTHFRERFRRHEGVRIVWLPSIPTKHLDTLTHAALSMVHALAARFDIYYVCIVGNSPVCLLGRLLGGKTILNVDGRDADREKWAGPAKRYIRWAERLAGRAADVVIADSTAISRRYAEELGTATTYIPYGAVPWPRAKEAANTATLRRFGLEPDRYILFVSRLTPENRAHVLLEAYRRAKVPLKCVIVGDAPYVADYKRALQAVPTPGVVFTGYQFGEAYRALSCHCRFFVLPSGIDGTRPVLLDQMAFGNCVVVRGTPANLEVVGPAGVSFDPGDEVEALRATLEKVAADDALVARCRQEAFDRVTRLYDWERIVDAYEALFTGLVAPKGARASGRPTAP
jgi:glycosyltransferase involved in cell wall biosynthesis